MVLEFCNHTETMDKCRSVSLIGKFIVCDVYSLQLLVLFSAVSCLPVSFRDHMPLFISRDLIYTTKVY